MTTYHNKTLYCNSGLTILINSDGSKSDTPNFFYKDQTNINWYVVDSSLNAVDLTGGTFEFKINSTYNGTNLVTVSSFATTNIANGNISCVASMNQAAILVLIDSVVSAPAQCALWMTKAGIKYCLASFACTISNLVF